MKTLLLCVLTLLTMPMTHSLAENAPITLYRDPYQVPSIEAKTLSDALFGLGYAMASDNAEQMARNYKQARGRSAEIDGKSQLTQDGFLRGLGIEAAAEARAATLAGEMAVLLKSFCDGSNRALAEQKATLPDWIQPFTLIDVLALAQLLNAAFPLEDLLNQLQPGTGSNEFVVGAKRSATGHPIVSIDPHLPWQRPFLWYEFALYTPGYSFRGITASGLPFGVMGHTDKIAWAITNNNPALYSIFTVKTNPENPKQYRYHDEWRDFETVPMELHYRENGEIKTLRQTIRKTAWGSMLPFRNQSVRFAMLGDWGMLEQTLAMARAKDAKQFRKVLQIRGLSMWNIAYADTKGSIGYQYNAHLPKRDPSFNWKKPVPGDTAKTKWGELWKLDDLPHVENPRSDLLINANTAPWLTSLGSEIKTEWDSYVTSYGSTTRYESLKRLLEPNHKVTVEQAKNIATDTVVPHAAESVTALVAAAKNGQPYRDALQVLQKWDHRADVDSQGCALYLYWFVADKHIPDLTRKAADGKAWMPEEQALALTALQKAAETLLHDHKRLDVPWGSVHIMQRGTKTVPASGFGYVVPGEENDTVAVNPNAGYFKDGQIHCTFGSSFRMVVHLNPKGIESWSILPYGNVQQTTNSSYTDQMASFGRGEYKPTFFGLSEIRKHSHGQKIVR